VRDPKAWLLVYLASSRLPGERWVDIGNDPELRTSPMTWGICRPNVRRWVDVGDELYFIAYRKDAGYHLSARLSVTELISPAEALARFPGRCNVILDHVPPADSVEDGVRRYLEQHRRELAWAKGDRDRARIALATDKVDPSILRDFTVEIDGTPYVHAYYDEHDDWKGVLGPDGQRHGLGRLNGPYAVGDAVESRILRDPIPYDVLANGTGLPASGSLRNRSNKHSARRIFGRDIAVVRTAVDDTPSRDVPPFRVGQTTGLCSDDSIGA
jgi:hypothetical protein